MKFRFIFDIIYLGYTAALKRRYYETSFHIR